MKILEMGEWASPFPPESSPTPLEVYGDRGVVDGAARAGVRGA